MKRKRLKASFTIEATVIVPITLVLTAALMITAFALHDRVILSTVSISEVMESADSAGKEPEQIRAAVSEVLGQRLLTAKEVFVNAEADDESVSLQSGGTVDGALSSVRDLLGEESSHLESRIDISNLQARKILVKYKTICDGISAVVKPSETSDPSE